MSDYEIFAKAQQAKRAKNMDRDAVCPTCVQPAWSPYRRQDREGIVEGCVDRIHERHISTTSLAWHQAFWKPRRVRKAA